jgi:ComF family protein
MFFGNTKAPALEGLYKGVSTFLRDISDLFIPPMCYFCHGLPQNREDYICDICLNTVELPADPVCNQCGIPINRFSDTGEDLFCGACLTKPPPYQKARYAAIFSDNLRQAVLDFKYRRSAQFHKPLGQILAMGYIRYFQDGIHDLIIPIPMHSRELRRRGFNQSALLASFLSKSIDAPFHRRALKKTKDTVPQVSLNDRQRLTNLKGGFSVADPSVIKGKRILLVDDVATTRTTITEASLEILKADAQGVDVMALALRPSSFNLKDNEKETPNGP